MSVQLFGPLIHKRNYAPAVLVIAIVIMLWIYFISCYILPRKTPTYSYSTQVPDSFEQGQFSDDVEIVTASGETLKTTDSKVSFTTLPAVVFVTREIMTTPASIGMDVQKNSNAKESLNVDLPGETLRQLDNNQENSIASKNSNSSVSYTIHENNEPRVNISQDIPNTANSAENDPIHESNPSAIPLSEDSPNYEIPYRSDKPRHGVVFTNGEYEYYYAYDDVRPRTEEPVDLSNYKKIYPRYKNPIDEIYLKTLTG